MSRKTELDYVDLVLHADIPTPTMKHLLLTIAVMANENGKCRPSITRLAKLTGLNRRTVTRNLQRLEKEYFLDIDRVGTPQNRETNFYELNYFKLQTEKVSLVGRGTKPLGGAQNPHQRDTVPPNTNTTAPRPTAAPQAQAGGSGVECNLKEELYRSQMEVKRLFEGKDSSDTSTEAEEAIKTTEPCKNPFEGREYITQEEFDQAFEDGYSPFELPEVRDE